MLWITIDSNVELVVRWVDGWLFEAGGAGKLEMAKHGLSRRVDDGDKWCGIVPIGNYYRRSSRVISNFISTHDAADGYIGNNLIGEEVDDLYNAMGVGGVEFVAIWNDTQAVWA